MFNDIEQIKKAGKRAAELTRQLLAYSRKQVLQPEILDPNVLIADMQKMLGRIAGQNVSLVMRLDPRLGRVKADRAQLQQVLLSLVNNSREAMPCGGSLTIATTNFEIDAQIAEGRAGCRPGQYVVLEVTDTGRGMDQQTLTHLFEPFFTTKEFGQRSGLELAMANGIVQQSGGFIDVQSTPGLGSTFRICLPRAKESVVLSSSDEVTGPIRTGHETILLVEDDDMVRSYTRSILERGGYRVLEARCGDEALKISRSHAGPIRLLIADVVLPEMNGRQLADRLQKLRNETDVLYISAYADETIGQHGVLDDQARFLRKPFTHEALMRKVRHLLDQPGPVLQLC